MKLPAIIIFAILFLIFTFPKTINKLINWFKRIDWEKEYYLPWVWPVWFLIGILAFIFFGD